MRWLILLLFLALASVFVIVSDGQTRDSDDSLVRKGFLRNQEDLVTKLARISNHYQVPVGLELSMPNNGVATPSENTECFRGNDLTFDLDSLVKRFSGYRWKLSDGQISVYPQDSHRDAGLATFLDSRAEYVNMKSRPSTYELKRRIAETRNIDATLNSLGVKLQVDLDFEADHKPFYYGFSEVYENRPVRDILDSITKRGPVLMWVAGRNDTDHSLLYFEFVLSAKRR